MAKTLIFSMAIDIQREEVLLPNDRRSITTKTNVNRTNKPSTNAGHLVSTLVKNLQETSDRKVEALHRDGPGSRGFRMDAWTRASVTW